MTNRLMLRTFNILETIPELVHAYSTRRGGVSSAPYDGLNLGMHTGDDLPSVRQNRQIFFNTLGIPSDRLVFPEQVHSDRVVYVTEPGVVPHCDGLITDRKDLYLTIQTADCFPVFLFEKHRQVAALVHSGWRGTAKNIVGRTVQKMVSDFNGRAENIVAAIGAGIQQACYQVDMATAEKFDPKYLLEDGAEHFLLNVQGNIVDQLLEAGVPAEQIEADATCTHCAADLYYSYRRDGTKSGRMMAVLGLRS